MSVKAVSVDLLWSPEAEEGVGKHPEKLRLLVEESSGLTLEESSLESSVVYKKYCQDTFVQLRKSIPQFHPCNCFHFEQGNFEILLLVCLQNKI